MNAEPTPVPRVIATARRTSPRPRTGLCEMVQHLAIFDYVAVSAGTTECVLEYVDHLHEHFTDPVRVVRGRYLAPSAAGLSATLRPESLRRYQYPSGSAWTATAESAEARRVGSLG
jgi:L-fuconate dehydratase